MSHERRHERSFIFSSLTRPLTRAVDTFQQSWGRRASGLLGWKVGPVLFQESPTPRPLTCHIPPFMHTHRERCLSTAQSSEGDSGEPGSGEDTKFTLWVWLRKLVHKDKRKDSTLLTRARLCLGEPGEPPPPAQRTGRRIVGMGVRSTSTHTRPGFPRSTGTGGSSPRG